MSVRREVRERATAGQSPTAIIAAMGRDPVLIYYHLHNLHADVERWREERAA